MPIVHQGKFSCLAIVTKGYKHKRWYVMTRDEVGLPKHDQIISKHVFSWVSRKLCQNIRCISNFIKLSSAAE